MRGLCWIGGQKGGAQLTIIMIYIVVFSQESTWCNWDDLDQTGAKYSAANFFLRGEAEHVWTTMSIQKVCLLLLRE